uniref:Nudix hydrolase domain-containing protein n=1 Tax=viral metagenome TaxID=1070528 RepID=A0A6C0BEP7_9ZZZZ
MEENNKSLQQSIINDRLYLFNYYNYDLVNHLKRYTPTSDEEQLYKEQILNFINEDVNCFERSNLKGHFTGSAWVTNWDGSKALITLHKKLGMFLQLGGHCDGDSNILRVAIKETMEESGITDLEFNPEIFDIDVHTIPEYKGIPEHKHYDIRFLIRVPSDSKCVIDLAESDELRWITKDDECNFKTSYGFRRMFSKWREMILNENDFQITDDVVFSNTLNKKFDKKSFENFEKIDF